MARPKNPNARTVVVAVRLSPKEAAQVDARRGRLTRTEWLRWLLLQDRKG